LQPIAGRLAFTIFAIGIIGTGFLAIPVLAGSRLTPWARPSAGIGPVAQAQPRQGLLRGHRGGDAAGVLLNNSPIDPIKALFWSAVINGVVAVPVMALMMHLSSHKAAMGDFQLGRGLKTVGWLATAVMAAAAVGPLRDLGEADRLRPPTRPMHHPGVRDVPSWLRELMRVAVCAHRQRMKCRSPRVWPTRLDLSPPPRGGADRRGGCAQTANPHQLAAARRERPEPRDGGMAAWAALADRFPQVAKRPRRRRP